MMKRTCPFALLAVLGCGESHLYFIPGLRVTDAETGNPVVNAEVRFAATLSERVADREPPEVLDEIGADFGKTDARGGFQLSVPGSSFNVFGDVGEARVTGAFWELPDDAWILSFLLPDGTRQVLSFDPSELLSKGFPEIQYGTVTLRATSHDTDLDPPPAVGRSGLSRVTLEITNLATGEPITGADVHFVTALHRELGGMPLIDYVDRFGQFVAKTNELGRVDTVVWTVVPAYRTCAFARVDDQWIVRVTAGELDETVVIRDESNEIPGGPSYIWGFRAVDGRAIHVDVPFQNCLVDDRGGGLR